MFSFTLGVVLNEMTADDNNDTLKGLKDFLNKGGNIGEAFGKLVDYCQKMGKMPKLAALITATFAKAYDQFEENYDVVMEKYMSLTPISPLLLSAYSTHLSTSACPTAACSTSAALRHR